MIKGRVSLGGDNKVVYKIPLESYLRDRTVIFRYPTVTTETTKLITKSECESALHKMIILGYNITLSNMKIEHLININL